MFGRKAKVEIPERMRLRLQRALAQGEATKETQARFWEAVTSVDSYVVEGDYADLMFVDETSNLKYEVNALVVKRSLLVGGVRVH